MRKQLNIKSTSYTRNPNDPIVRGSFVKHRKLYSRKCKQKRREFKKVLLEKLDTLICTKMIPLSIGNLLKILKMKTLVIFVILVIKLSRLHGLIIFQAYLQSGRNS